MRKHIQFLGFLLVVFGFQLPAQTIKNIYRHNQPVLRIPTHLIDKVETHDEQGTPHLRVIQFNGQVNDYPLAQIDSITHSPHLNPETYGNPRISDVSGVVRDQFNSPIANARVVGVYGGEETITDNNGFFRLNNIVSYDKIGSVHISKETYFNTSKSFLPLDGSSNFLIVQLVSAYLSGSFPSDQGGQITTGTLSFTFTPNSIEKNGQPYNGIVGLYASALDPTITDQLDRMPGNLLANQNDSLVLLKSFGMAAVELRSPNGELLQLKEGHPATIRFTIPASLASEAPNSIDFWSFDEMLGTWKHEGIAQKQGSSYVGQASHFSWYNVDIPFPTPLEVRGTVVSSNNQPIAGARINFYSPTTGFNFDYTNEFGEFGLPSPMNSTLTIVTSLLCNIEDEWVPFDTLIVNIQNEDVDVLIELDIVGRIEVSGTAVDCEGGPVDNGYILVNHVVYPITNGNFLFFHCQNAQLDILAFDITAPDSVSASGLTQITLSNTDINIGTLNACETFFSTVQDIDGQIYPTVKIGEQWWMAANLNTSRFSDGTVIPEVFDDQQWIELNSPASTYYSNSYSNIIFGRLYNGYVATNSVSVCPTGWRTPSSIDWEELINFLGGEELAGGKMKNPLLWWVPVDGFTNESGFTALPAGYRTDVYGFYSEAGTHAFFWSNTPVDATNLRYYYMNNLTLGVFNTISDVRKGFSIRCVKD